MIPKARQITRWLLTRPDTLNADEQAQLAGIQDRCPHLNALATHVRTFAEIMTRRRGQQDLESWLTAVEADDQPELHSFANGICRDKPSPTGSPCPTAPAPSKATSSRSRCSNGKCTAAPAWSCSASESSFTPGNTSHGIGARARNPR